MAEDKPIENRSNPPEKLETCEPEKPLIRYDGQINTDGGQLLFVQYVDIGLSKKNPRPTKLVKGTEAEYSLAHSGTIRVSNPRRFRDFGESLIQDDQEGRAESREEEGSSTDYTKERQEQEQALIHLGMNDAALGSHSSYKSSHHADNMTFGGGCWIFCAAIQPESQSEWTELQGSLPASYNDYTTVHQARRFAQALGLAFVDQVGPQGKEGYVTHNAKDADPVLTLHDSQMILHGPVWYTDDVYQFLRMRQGSVLEKLYPLFVKDRRYAGQREYRFVIVGNRDAESQYLDLRVTGMMRDSLVPCHIVSEVRVKPATGKCESDAPLSVEPKTFFKRESKSRKRVETLTRTIAIAGQESVREVQKNEVIVTVTSGSVVGKEAFPDMPGEGEGNLVEFVERRSSDETVDGATVETFRGENTRVGYVKDGYDSDMFSLEDRLEAREIINAAKQFNGTLRADREDLRNAIQKLVERVLDPDNAKNADVTSSAWHGLWALVNLHRSFGDVVNEIEVEQERFISIALKPSLESQATGKILVGPLGTYAYVLRKEEEPEWGYGGEDTRLVLFPDEETLEKFVEFGWEAGSATEQAPGLDGGDEEEGVTCPSDGE